MAQRVPQETATAKAAHHHQQLEQGNDMQQCEQPASAIGCSVETGIKQKAPKSTAHLANPAPNVSRTFRLRDTLAFKSGRADEADWREEEFKFGGTSVRLLHARSDFYSVSLMGLMVWPGAQLLCDYMASQLDCQHSSVLELGAGTGLCGLSNALLFGGARNERTVVLTDGPKAPLSLIARNVIAAQAENDVHVCQLEWGESASLAELPLQAFDLVVASDCCFSHESMKLVFETIRKVRPETLLMSERFWSHGLWDEIVELASAQDLKLVEPSVLPEGTALESVEAIGGIVLHFRRADHEGSLDAMD